ncbi:TrmH family RNA methyltransferase [Aquimarina brevivitae]|uniref:TrmH family RNA methyltransferase n=1 Tax=Aquimarina brevivitae TaxID=323412 RepID=A0A4Q7PIH1_9FLAO|nr:RNA methyltransferase [Aquimarina brevivitae]RZT00377.1 TrmH family RNA methyltransferase [Aquimarina brevivitae]
MSDTITSIQNPRIKFLASLQEKSRVRRKEQKFSVEGVREIMLAVQGGYTLLELYYCDSILQQENLNFTSLEGAKLIAVSKEVYNKLAYRSSTEGVIGLFKSKDHDLSLLNINQDSPLYLIAQSIEKPGNIGALLRTADAANIDAVIIADPLTDIYNPNIIRSSVGCVFTNTIITETSENIITFLHKNKINIYGAALQASVDYHRIDYTQPSAIVVGTEATGLTDLWLKNTTKNIKIPMQGKIDSMNVSVAAGILVFEAKRQRDFTN